MALATDDRGPLRSQLARADNGGSFFCSRCFDMGRTRAMAGLATDVQLVGHAIAVDIRLAIRVVDRTSDIFTGIQLVEAIAGIVAGSALLFKGLADWRIGEFLGFLIEEPVGMVISELLPRPVAVLILPMLVILQERIQTFTNTEEIALFVHCCLTDYPESVTPSAGFSPARLAGAIVSRGS